MYTRLKKLKQSLKENINFYSLYLFVTKRHINKEIPLKLYIQECKKYKKAIKTDIRKDLIFEQIKIFFLTSLTLMSDNLVFSDDKRDPIVFVVVRNEIERMKIFFDHYRKLGIHQFVVLDNGSDDGTLEFVMNQNDTKVYQTLNPYQTEKRISWLEKLLVLNGMNRWCIVVDSDELLDYEGSNEHSIKDLVQKSVELGHNRIWGLMLDMYSKEPLFSEEDIRISITENYKYFDTDSYVLNIVGEPDAVKLFDEIYGGPRYRVFKQKMTLSKQAIFYFGKDVLYRNSHFLSPVIRWGEAPCWFVLKHYKFLQNDKAEYERRVKKKCFFLDSKNYKSILKQIGDNKVSLFYEGSYEFKDSSSLKCLPYLEEIPW